MSSRTGSLLLLVCALNAGPIAMSLHAQGPAAGPAWPAAWQPPELQPEPPRSAVHQELRRSRGGHAALVGGLIGAGVGVAGALLTNGFCQDSEIESNCGGKAAIVFAGSAAVGALIGWFVGH